MKISITINEEFSTADALAEFATKLSALFNSAFSLPPVSVALPVAKPASTVFPVSQPPAVDAAPYSAISAELPPVVKTSPAAVVTGSEATGSQPASGGTVSVIIGQGGGSGGHTSEAAQSVPPAGTAKRPRGRPSAKDKAADAAPQPPVVNAGGVAPVSPAEVSAAIQAGASEADQILEVQSIARKFLEDFGVQDYLPLLSAMGAKNARDIPADKRQEFIAKLKAKGKELAAAAKAAA